MRDIRFIFWAGPPRLGSANMSRFARLIYVGKWAGHQLPSPDSRPAH